MGKMVLLIGTYTSEGGEGISASTFEPLSGSLSEARRAAAAQQPSYLAMHPGGKFLYAVCELSEADGTSGGGVSAFSYSPSTGGVSFINSQPAAGGAPCHVSCHPGGRWVAVTNYASGTAAIFPAGNDGALGEASCVVGHPSLPDGNGGMKQPHAHSLVFDAGGARAFVADLGIDRLMIYRFDDKRGTLTPDQPAFFGTRAGAGPRALALHPDGRRACLVNELDSTLTLLEMAPARGAVRALDTVGTLPAGWAGENACADVHVHPLGKYVYCSNRGHDSIAVFAIRGATLEQVGIFPTGGKWPRSFCLDPEGRWIIVANQHSNDVSSLRIDLPSGLLRPTERLLKVGAPAFVTLVG